jgi:hypothetical protein
MVRSFLVAVLAVSLIVTGLLAPAAGRVAASGATTAPQRETIVAQPDLCFGFTAESAFNQTGAASFPCNSGCVLFQSSYNVQYIPIVCPGPPASIAVAASPTSVSCASSSNLEVAIYDANGLAVADDTSVSFTTDLGSITPDLSVMGGTAVASLSMLPKTTGVAHVSVTSGAASAQKTISVTC